MWDRRGGVLGGCLGCGVWVLVFGWLAVVWGWYNMVFGFELCLGLGLCSGGFEFWGFGFGFTLVAL